MVITNESTLIVTTNYCGNIEYEPIAVNDLYQIFRDRLMDELTPQTKPETPDAP